jgi:hypothetical protein
MKLVSAIQSIAVLFFSLTTLHSQAQSADGFIYQPLSSGKALPGTTKNSHASYTKASGALPKN